MTYNLFSLTTSLKPWDMYVRTVEISKKHLRQKPVLDTCVTIAHFLSCSHYNMPPKWLSVMHLLRDGNLLNGVHSFSPTSRTAIANQSIILSLWLLYVTTCRPGVSGINSTWIEQEVYLHEHPIMEGFNFSQEKSIRNRTVLGPRSTLSGQI